MIVEVELSSSFRLLSMNMSGFSIPILFLYGGIVQYPTAGSGNRTEGPDIVDL